MESIELSGARSLKVKRVLAKSIILEDCIRRGCRGPQRSGWSLPLAEMMEMSKLIRELKQVLYGNSESESVAEACAQLTSEFFRENTLRLLIICLPKLNLEVRKDISQVVAKLQRQQVQSRLIECDYLEKNLDLLDILLQG
ncbi:putative MO25-like protein At5g47540 isoform X1 [Primulina eburnea]|uniref:putative MO25-like protein At5g47540 isoform X1 n=1 Tax=Primulina eburnea TaxID=1245227 RepID=UPI003C6BE011